MGKPKAPKPPSPQDTAAAQTGTNIGTAITGNTMGMVNQVTPYGSLNYSQTGSSSYTDPFTGKTYDIPQYTATTSLNPQQQATLDTTQAAQGNLADIAQNQSAFLKDYLGTGFDPGTDVEDRLYDLASRRIDPRFEREEDALRTRLANQGLAPGSEAYNREIEALGQTKNDAYNSLALTGRSQALNEAFATRNQPINEITALLSGSQVQNPNVSMAQMGRPATTDVAGLINTNYGQRFNNYNSRLNSWNDLMGGLFSLGAAKIGAA